MSVSPDEVLHLARLAEIAVDPAELPALSTQLDRIVAFVAQLNTLDAARPTEAAIVGPAASPLRADLVRPAGLVRDPEATAPEFVDGFFVVPRLGAMNEP